MNCGSCPFFQLTEEMKHAMQQSRNTITTYSEGVPATDLARCELPNPQNAVSADTALFSQTVEVPEGIATEVTFVCRENAIRICWTELDIQ